MQFVIEPHRGIGPVSFGMSRSEVSAAMAAVGGGPPRPRNEETDGFFDFCIQVSYDEGGRAEFVEVANDAALVFAFQGRDVFDMPGAELLDLIGALDQPDPDLSREGCEYIFPRLILTLWDLDEQYDHKGGEQRPVFAAVGVGTPKYLAAVRAIRAGRPA